MPRGVKNGELKHKIEAPVYLREDEQWQATPETVARVQSLAKLITDGKSRASIQQYVKDNYKVGDRQARAYFNSAMKYLQPEDANEFRNNMAYANIGRLEKIIELNIDRAPKIAIAAIGELNKLLGLTNGNGVTIAQNDKGEQVIKINFE